jgi:hypothetical protein
MKSVHAFGNVAFVIALASCAESAPAVTSPTNVAPSPTASATAIPAPSVAAPVADAGRAPFVAWTDPAAIDALLAGEAPSNDTDDPRSCYFHLPEQSCIPGSANLAWSCQSDCAQQCDRGGAACLKALSPCRGACAAGDSACARRCGQVAGGCIQDAMTVRDRCATADCAKALADYETDLRTNYGCKDKRTALAICEATVACIAGCNGAKGSSDDAQSLCRDRCKRVRARGCDKNFLDMVDLGACGQFDLSP